MSHYEILEQLGRGGMGIVYKARDTRLDRFVALKFLPPELTRDVEAKERFIREARTASSFDHPNICTVYEIGETDHAQSFIAMPCYEGETLRSRIEKGRLAVDEAVGIAAQIARGLAKAHQKDIIHRDVKPANIIITTEGVAKILDFGLAKLRGLAVVTRTGATVGTLSYMSPEQAKGHPVDQRTDVWSLGVVLYEMLSGTLPFKGEYDLVIVYSILNQDPAPLAQVRPDIPEDVRAIVERCLQKDPARRFQSMRELEHELLKTRKKLSVHGEPHGTDAPGRLPGAQAPGRRRTLIAAAADILLVAVVLLFPLRRQTLRFLGVSPGAGEKHVAILADASNSSDAAFCRGMVEVLTEWVARHRKSDPRLSVIPSIEIQKDGVTTASEARKMFGATVVISVRSGGSGSRQRLILNLIDARTLRMLNSEEVEASGDALFSLESLAQIKVAELLEMPVPTDTQGLGAGPAVSSRSYDYYLRGRGYLQRYDRVESVDSAAAMFRNSLAEDSTFTPARAGLAEAYWRRYDLERNREWASRAAEESARAMASGEKSAVVYATAGLIAAGTGNFAGAVTDYEQAEKLDPGNADAAGGLARAYEGLNDPVRAESEFRKAVEIQPGSWTAFNQLGGFYARHGRYEDAIAPFMEVIKLVPGNSRVFSNLGGIYTFLGQYDKAELILERSIAIEPTYIALSNLATCYYKEKRYADAAEKTESALRLNDSDYRLWGNLASIYNEIPGKKDSATSAYRRAIAGARERLAVKPDDPIVLAELAGYYCESGLRAEAQAAIRKALALGPEEGEVLFLAGCIAEENGDRTGALAYLQKSLEKGYAYGEITDYPGLADLRKDSRFSELKPHR